MGEMRFYCRECDRIIDRRKVIPKQYEEGFRCKWCGSTVLSTRKLLAKIIKDYIDYLESKGEDVGRYE